MAISSRAKVDRGAAASVAMVAEVEPLIPGLPDDVAEHCLVHLPFPHQSMARSVSSAWNRAITDPSFLLSRKALQLPLPYIFVFAFHRATFQLQWIAFDPRSRSWLLLPSMPLGPEGSGLPPPLVPSAFACVSNPSKGEIFVLGGMRSDTEAPLQTLISYRASTNSWSIGAPMSTPRSHFAAGCIGGRIYAAGGGGGSGGGGGRDSQDAAAATSVEYYDPAEDTWRPATGMPWGVPGYDAAAVGGKMYITEGWTWPFSFSPRGGVYDPATDEWTEMKLGMREGWTGSSVVLGEKLFVISECGECRLKVYDEERDAWEGVMGPGVPAEVRKPFAVCGAEGRVYVVAAGMSVAVGKLEEVKKGGRWRVEWEVVKGPMAFGELRPCSSQVLYA